MPYSAEVWSGSREMVIWRCAHEHRTAREAQECADRELARLGIHSDDPKKCRAEACRALHVARSDQP